MVWMTRFVVIIFLWEYCIQKYLYNLKKNQVLATNWYRFWHNTSYNVNKKICCLHTISCTIKIWFIKQTSINHQQITLSPKRHIHIVLHFILQTTIADAFSLYLRFHSSPLPNWNSFCKKDVCTLLLCWAIYVSCIRIFLSYIKSLFIGVFWHKGRYGAEFACVN